MDAATLAPSLAWCREATRFHAKSFHFASFALPQEKKDAACAVYAFCRHADDLVDKAGPAGSAYLVAEDFDRITAGQAADLPFAAAFAWAVERYEIPRQPFLDLMDGVARDRGPVRIQTWEELKDYCYHVASVVGLMLTPIFELREPSAREQAIELGIAMQLTNILRDVGEDFAMNRVYLPSSELAAFRVSELDLQEKRVTPEFVRLMKFQVERAREYYKRAEKGIPYLADDGSQFTVWLMRKVYAGILDEIERCDYDVFRVRAKTGFLRKLALGWDAWLCCKRTRE